MNIPTNKLSDLIATLQTLDPDTNHHYVSAAVFITRAGRRFLDLRYNDNKLVNIDTLLDDIYELLTVDDYPIAEDCTTVEEFKAALIKHLADLHEQIDKLQNPAK